MPRSKVVRINSSLYLNVPAEEARRLHLREGQVVDYDLRAEGTTVAEAVADLRGKYKGRLPRLSDRDLWGRDWA
jgi:hypothetical protein